MKQLERLKSLLMSVLVISLSLSLVSCGDDDESIPEITDYYMTCTVRGGGLSTQDLEALEAQLNAALTQYQWSGIDLDHALYNFGEQVEAYRLAFSDGYREISNYISDTLRITFQLKTKAGVTVTTSTLNVTKDGCTIS